MIRRFSFTVAFLLCAASLCSAQGSFAIAVGPTPPATGIGGRPNNTGVVTVNPTTPAPADSATADASESARLQAVRAASFQRMKALGYDADALLAANLQRVPVNPNGQGGVAIPGVTPPVNTPVAATKPTIQGIIKKLTASGLLAKFIEQDPNVQFVLNAVGFLSTLANPEASSPDDMTKADWEFVKQNNVQFSAVFQSIKNTETTRLANAETLKTTVANNEKAIQEAATVAETNSVNRRKVLLDEIKTRQQEIETRMKELDGMK